MVVKRLRRLPRGAVLNDAPAQRGGTAGFELVTSPRCDGSLGDASKNCPCPWCFEATPSGYGSFHGACLDAYTSHPTFVKWRNAYESGFDPCGLCGGNRRVCRC